MELIIRTDGTAVAIYGEELDLAALGDVQVKRASHVEHSHNGWHVDLWPMGGPQLGPFARRSVALEVEAEWLREHLE